MREAGHNLAAVRIEFSGPYESVTLAPTILTDPAKRLDDQELCKGLDGIPWPLSGPYRGPYGILGSFSHLFAFSGP